MILSLLFNKYTLGAAIILMAALGGYHLLKKNWELQERAKTLERVIKKNQEVQKDVDKAREELKDLDADELAEYYRTGRLPKRKR